jgi:two-component sensor histidine kinase
VAPETVRLRIRNVANAVLVSGQAYQEPKDALNEFVSNAADEYAEAGLRGGRIRVHLRRKGKRPLIAIEDDGRGMTAERLRDVYGVTAHVARDSCGLILAPTGLVGR